MQAHKTPRIWLAVIGAMLGLAACNSPTLPLPPPAQPDVTVQQGMALLVGERGSVEPKALVIAVNSASGQGAVATADYEGAWRMQVQAKRGDAIELWQRVGNDDSDSIVVVVP